MSSPDPGRILRRALVAWGLGHLALGRTTLGAALLLTELVAVVVVAWLTLNLADSSAYLVPFVAGIGFIVAWAWQAIHAYRAAHRLEPAQAPTPERSAAAAMGWLSLPLLIWGSGFWLIGAGAASPEAVLDRFVTEWSGGELGPAWPANAVRAAEAAAAELGPEANAFRDVRVRIVTDDGGRAIAVAEATHFERHDSRFLGLFAGAELVPVADERVLTLELAAQPVDIIGAVRWELVDATR